MEDSKIEDEGKYGFRWDCPTCGIRFSSGKTVKTEAWESLGPQIHRHQAQGCKGKMKNDVIRHERKRRYGRS